MATGQISCISPSFTAVETALGWTVQGAQPESPSSSSALSSELFLSLVEAPHEDAVADVKVSFMWCLEAIDGQGTSEKLGFNNLAVHHFEHGIRKLSDHYEVPLLIKEPGFKVSDDNYRLGEQRLYMQLKRFRGQPYLLRHYDKTIHAYFNEGHAERMTCNKERWQAEHTLYATPWCHASGCSDEVFDASSHVPGHPSLNSMLLKGPKLDAHLLKLLV